MRRAMPCCWPLLLLAACAETPANMVAGSQACTVQKIADIAVVAERSFVTAPASIDGKPVTMLVDTGSEMTTITPDAVAALRLASDPHAVTTVIGTGGRITRRNVRLQSFGIGGLEVLDQSYGQAALPSLSMLEFSASGVLGASWLSDYDVDLDLPHGRIGFYAVQSCNADHVPWAGSAGSVPGTRPDNSVPARLFGRGLVLLPVSLNGAAVTAILDSGSAQSALTKAAAAAAGASAAALAQDPGGRATGADGSISFVRQHRFDTLQVGAGVSQGMRLAVGDLHIAGGAQMLLGLDWLRRHHVWISYATHRVFIAP